MMASLRNFVRSFFALYFLSAALSVKLRDKSNKGDLDPSVWSWLSNEVQEPWSVLEKLQLGRMTFRLRSDKQKEMERYLKTLPEPNAGESFHGQSFPMIAATLAPCGAAVTIQIKNYLNESLFGEDPVLWNSKAVRSAPKEILPYTKEIFVVKDKFNRPKAGLVYSVGNTTVQFSMSFVVEDEGTTVTLVYLSRNSLFPHMKSRHIGPVSFQNIEEKFHIPWYRHRHNIEMDFDLDDINVRLTSKLALPSRTAVTLEVFRFEAKKNIIKKAFKTTSSYLVH